jgi:hypothetical protein
MINQSIPVLLMMITIDSFSHLAMHPNENTSHTDFLHHFS